MHVAGRQDRYSSAGGMGIHPHADIVIGYHVT
jgi:hypothetical protein